MDDHEKAVSEVRVACLTLPGRFHRTQGESSEDVILRRETSEFRFYGLADGQTGKKHCRTGGKAALQVVAEYLSQKKISVLKGYEHVDEIQYEIICSIRRETARLAQQYGTDPEEFSSTIVSFAFDPQTGDSITVHLGDGGILGRCRDHTVRHLSVPENGISSIYTWLTTSRGALPHLRVSFGDVRMCDRYLLYSDGASALCWGKNISRTARKLIQEEENAVRILQYVKMSEPEDDAGCIILDMMP